MLTKEEIREALVERHSEEVQSKLDEAKVAIAGLGGLGSNIAFFLTRIGVGHLHLIDFRYHEFKPSAVSHGTYWQIQDGSTFGGTSGNQSIP